MKPIRNSVKAVILRGGQVLVIKKTGSDGVYYILPGGGQEPGEDFVNVLKRECREEIGVDVQIEDLIYVREYIGKNHEFSATHDEVHQIEFMFSCTLTESGTVEMGSSPDQDQIGVAWLPLSSLPQEPFFPRALGVVLADSKRGDRNIYLGDVN